jgi:hypothetical protein
MRERFFVATTRATTQAPTTNRCTLYASPAGTPIRKATASPFAAMRGVRPPSLAYSKRNPPERYWRAKSEKSISGRAANSAQSRSQEQAGRVV